MQKEDSMTMAEFWLMALAGGKCALRLEEKPIS